jgi:NTE family protein
MKTTAALVLSSGGARGLAHIGIIEELENQGFEIKSVAGTSMGAMIGGIYAMGKLHEFTEWVTNLRKIDVFNLIDFTFSSQGIIKGDRVFKKLKSFISDGNIEDFKIPYAAVATDITNEKEVVFTSGSFYDAVRASLAIPTVFTPSHNGNLIYVDGGVLNPVPADRVTRTPGDILIVVDVYADIPFVPEENPIKKEIKAHSVYEKNIHLILGKFNDFFSSNQKPQKLGYFRLVDAVTSAMVHRISSLTMEKYKPDILINISKNAGQTFDFYKAEQLIELGRNTARKTILDFRKKSIRNED